MTDPLPEPLTHPASDLRAFPYMPLDVMRLRDSDLAALEDAEAFRAAVISWCVAWHQIPAASLPGDDAVLCRLLGYGRDMTTWRRVREAGALSGYVLCSDGRLYHPVVAEKANTALKSQEIQRNRTAAAREARLSQKAKNSVTENVTVSVPTLLHGPTVLQAPTVTVTRKKEKKDSVLRTGEDSPTDPKAELWKDGLSTLMRLTGKPVGPSRKLLGKMSGDARGDHGRLLALIREAEIQQPDQPEAWLVASMKSWHGKNGHTTFPSLFDVGPWGLQAWADAQPDAIKDRVDGEVVTCVGGYGVVEVGKMIAEAAHLPEGWHGSWDDLGGWLRDGIDSLTIVGAIKKSAQWEGYRPPATIRYFDKPVREAGARLRDFR